MDFENLQHNWDRLGREDALWSISTHPDFKGGQWDLDTFFRTGVEQLEALMQCVLERVELPNGRALDFGCGVGRLTHALAEYMDEVVGVDVASSMIEGARGLHADHPRLRFVLNDRPDLSVFVDDHFDFVLTEITLMHMRSDFALGYVQEFFRVCRPGGVVMFHLPVPTFRSRIRSVLPSWAVDMFVHMRSGTPHMEKHGVDRIEVETVIQEAGGSLVSVVAPPWLPERRGDHRYIATA